MWGDVTENRKTSSTSYLPRLQIHALHSYRYRQPNANFQFVKQKKTLNFGQNKIKNSTNNFEKDKFDQNTQQRLGNLKLALLP